MAKGRAPENLEKKNHRQVKEYKLKGAISAIFAGVDLKSRVFIKVHKGRKG